jgi:hypothetical protein
MLTKFFLVEFVANPFYDTLSPRLSDNIPVYTCAFFSENISKFAFCVDASIDLAAICAELGLPCEFIHDLEVLEEEYNKEYYVGLKGPNQWYLCKIPEKPANLAAPDPSYVSSDTPSETPSDPSQNQ